MIVGIRQHWPLTLAKTGTQKRKQIIRRLMTVKSLQNGSDMYIPITVFNKNKWIPLIPIFTNFFLNLFDFEFISFNELLVCY